ncbi:DUF899 family protein [Amycolatopsis sp. NPDC051371]|uniref:DUF899 family protein n=1 Tax=Amycolatopsis sp. NPDC051371 TaxID=3155800 RepID=UPI0034334DCF
MTELVLPELTEPRLLRPRPVPPAVYRFAGPAGPVTLTGLFDGHRRLAVHHTMPNRSRPGAVQSTEDVAAALHAADTRLVIVSQAPYPKLEQYGRHFGWGLPAYSAQGTGFGADFPATWYLEDAGHQERDEAPGLSFFALDRSIVRHLGSIVVSHLDFLDLAGVAGDRPLA